MAWRGAAISHTRENLNFRAGPALHGQFNRTFVVGLAGATIASLGLFTLSRAAANQRRGARQTQGGVRLRLRSTTDCENFPFGH